MHSLSQYIGMRIAPRSAEPRRMENCLQPNAGKRYQAQVNHNSATVRVHYFPSLARFVLTALIKTMHGV